MSPAATTVKKVLLIDDDQDDFAFFEEAVRQIDPSIEVAHISNVNDLPKDGSCNIPDVLFLDINMPDKNGFEWLKDIRAKGYDLPIVMYSTASNPVYVERAYAEGATVYFPKPDNFSTLIESLRKLFQFNWSSPKDIYQHFCHNGQYRTFSA
jgi:DNA-binding NarL/FixJ family response regulator